MAQYTWCRSAVSTGQASLCRRLTLEKVSYDPSSQPAKTSPTTQDSLEDLNSPTAPLPILIRATDGKASKPSAFHASAANGTDSQKPGQSRKKKLKLSTIVQPNDLEAFYTRYAEVCKVGMAAGLKKRDRKGRKEKKKKKRVG